MQADEIRLVLHAFGECGDRQRGRVGSEQGVGGDELFDLLEGLLLDRDVFEDRLDHQVAAGEVCRHCGGSDPRQQRGSFLRRRPASGDVLFQELGRVVLAPFGRFLRDVFEDHVDAALGADISDAGTHHSSAEHRDLLRGGLVESLRPACSGIDFREVEEKGLGHVFGDLAGDQFDEIP